MKRLFWPVLLDMILLVGLTVAFAPVASAAGPPSLAAGAVYTMTNDPADNEVVVFERATDGMLTMVDSVSTQGLGSDGGFDPLTSQGSLVLSHNGKWLLAVNAGSDEITVFGVKPGGLEFADKIASGGTMPVSLTISFNRVYVLNAGGTPNITGFILGPKGTLHAIPSSTRNLGSGAFSQVGFDNLGTRLVVTDRADSEILVFNMHLLVPAASPVVTSSNGPTPFAFIFDKQGRLLVVEINGNNGAITSYSVNSDGSLDVISPSVASGQAAACWIAGNNKGDVYTINPGSPSISSYKENPKGEVSLLDATATMDFGGLDAGVSNNGWFLYALASNDGGIAMYQINQDGSLTALGLAPGGLSAYAQGLAVK